MTSKLWEKLIHPDYRKAFVGSQINIGVPFQLRALLKASEWTQQQLANKAEMLQPRISAMLKPGGAKFTIETLRRLAAAFDVALIVKFVPFSELVEWSENFAPETFSVPTFEQEMARPSATSSFVAAAAAAATSTIEGSITEIDREWPTFSRGSAFTPMSDTDGAIMQKTETCHEFTMSVAALAGDRND